MANPSRNPAEDVTKTANQTADHIEQAVRSGDKDAYNKAMGEVNAYRDKHTPDETKAYSAAVTKRLETDQVLPTVSLFEAQTNFAKIDTGANGRLEKPELDLYANRKDVNEVQAALVRNIQQNYDSIRNYNTWWENWHGGNSDAISDTDVNTGVEQQRAILNLHAPGKDGISLYDKLHKDANGNILNGTLDQAMQGGEAVARSLTPEDKQTIETLQKNMPWFRWNDFDKDKLDQFERDAGLDPNVVQNQRRSARAETQVPIENLPPRQEQMQKDYEREQSLAKEREATQAKERDAQTRERDARAKDREAYYRELDARHREARERERYYDSIRKERNEDKISEALTIRKGESYAHSAERLLALAGNNDPSSKELKDVSHQLWIADQKRKAGELRTGQTLHLDATLRHNPALAKLFDGSDL